MSLVTGKAVTIPGLTMNTVASESMTDAEAVRRIMETIQKTTTEFRDAEMKIKLKLSTSRILYRRRQDMVPV